MIEIIDKNEINEENEQTNMIVNNRNTKKNICNTKNIIPMVANIVSTIGIIFFVIAIITGFMYAFYNSNKKNIHQTTFTLTGTSDIVTYYCERGSNCRYYGYCDAISTDIGYCEYIAADNDDYDYVKNKVKNKCIQNTTYEKGYYNSNKCYSKNPNKSDKYYKQKTTIVKICIMSISIALGLPILTLILCCCFQVYLNDVNDSNNIKN